MGWRASGMRGGRGSRQPPHLANHPQREAGGGVEVRGDVACGGRARAGSGWASADCHGSRPIPHRHSPGPAISSAFTALEREIGSPTQHKRSLVGPIRGAPSQPMQERFKSQRCTTPTQPHTHPAASPSMKMVTPKDSPKPSDTASQPMREPCAALAAGKLCIRCASAAPDRAPPPPVGRPCACKQAPSRHHRGSMGSWRRPAGCPQAISCSPWF